MEVGATGLASLGPAGQGVDLTNFGQWLMEQQSQLVRKMVGQQERGQALLMRELVKVWKSQEGTPTAPGRGLGCSPWPLLTKLGESDDIKAYLESFERNAEAAKWPKDQ